MNENSQLIINKKNPWVLISFGQLRLMIPQQQVETLEAYAIMEMNNAKNFEIGHFVTEDFTAPIYCLSEQLKFLKSTPEDYSYFAVIRHQQFYFGLCCENISTHSAGHNKAEIPLPGCMLSSSAIFKQYAVLNNQLHLVTDSETLFALIQERTNNSVFSDNDLLPQTSNYGATS